MMGGGFARFAAKKKPTGASAAAAAAKTPAVPQQPDEFGYYVPEGADAVGFDADGVGFDFGDDSGGYEEDDYLLRDLDAAMDQDGDAAVAPSLEEDPALVVSQ